MDMSQPDTQGVPLGQLLAQVARQVGTRMRARIEGLGLHRAQAWVLFQLWQEDGVPQNVLAQGLQIAPATATNTLQRMERDGWVERRRDAADQRVLRVYLTGKGRALQEEVRASLRELDRELTATLSADECRIFGESLLKVRARLAPEEPA